MPHHHLPIHFLRSHLHSLPPDSPCADLYRVHRLVDAVNDVFNGTSHGHSWAPQLEQSLTDLHESMRDADSPSTLASLRLAFADCSILLAILYNTASRPLDAIAVLDKSIIVAGPSGEERFGIVHSLIRTSQEVLPTDVPYPIRPALGVARRTVHPACDAPCTITCLPSPPSMIAFQTRYSKQPFIIRQFAQSWPALNDHPWASTAYLKSIAGPGRIVPVEVGKDYRDDDWSQAFMKWDDFLPHLNLEEAETSVADSAHQTLYLAQYDLSMQFPRLRDDIVVPDYVYACLSPDYVDYQPPPNEDGMIVNMWLGKDTMSPAHVDPFHNLYFQVVGRKQVWLAPPSISDSMYCTSTSAQGREGISNTSKVDVFTEDAGDLQAKFPKFVSDVLPQATSAHLGPGDLLYFPPGWWHAMQAFGTSFSVSVWF